MVALALVVGAVPTQPEHPQPARFSEGYVTIAPSAVPVVSSANSAMATNEIDVLFVFSGDVYSTFGSGAAVRSYLEGALAGATAVSDNSGVASRYRLVASVGVEIPEPIDSESALRSLTLVDGVADEVFSLREQYSADAVVLVVGDLTDFDGIAWIGPDPSTAFAVVDLDCPAVCIAHELGHLHGNAHDEENAGGPGRTEYAYGHRVPGSFRSVMAYPCVFQGLAQCETVPYFSSPNLSWNGEPLGSAEADNVRSMNEVSSTVAAAAPGQPTFPPDASLDVVDNGDGSLQLAWPGVANTTGYGVRVHDLDTGGWMEDLVVVTSVTLRGLSVGHRVSVQVVAWDGAGRSSFDGPATIVDVGSAPAPSSTTTTVPQHVGTFSDDDGSAFQAEIEWLAESGITQGCGDGLFCPTHTVTRGQMAAFLRRALDLPVPVADTFTDDDGSPFEPDIEAIATAGITQGCDEGRFCPDASVTREQMAAFLTRALSLAPSSTDAFVDDDGRFLEPEIQALAASGITQGCAAERFCPSDPVTREQMAAFLFRALA